MAVTVHSAISASVNFALSYLSGGDIASSLTELSVDSENLTLCYKFEDENFQPYPTTHLEVKMITDVHSSTGSPTIAVVDVPEVLQFRGYGISDKGLDRAYWVQSHHSCNQNSPELRADLEERIAETSNVSETGQASFTFTTRAAGMILGLCYQFGEEWAMRVENVTMRIGEIQAVEVNVGDLGVSVVDAQKRLTFSGEFLSPGDEFRWGKEGNCSVEHAAAIYENTTNTLLVGDTPVVAGFTTSTHTLYTLKPEMSGMNLTLCYRFKGEPWRGYNSSYTTDVRMVHEFSSTTGDFNRSVVEQMKRFEFTGDGVANTDKVKFVRMFDPTKRDNEVDANDCYNETMSASSHTGEEWTPLLANADWEDATSHTHSILTDDEDLPFVGPFSASFNFTDSPGGFLVALCYKFDNEPFQLYSQHVTEVHHVRNLSSFVGGPDMMYVDVGERLGVHGDFISGDDRAR